MAITKTLKRMAISLKLNAGTTTTGQVKTVSVGIGTLSTNVQSYDTQKALNIANALYRCLDLPVYGLEETQVSELSEE